MTLARADWYTRPAWCLDVIRAHYPRSHSFHIVRPRRVLFWRAVEVSWLVSCRRENVLVRAKYRWTIR